MNYQCALIVVRDMESSRKFYCDLLGLQVTADFGANITLSDCVALQTIETWQDFIHRSETEITLGHNAAELYFEESDMDSFLQKLEAYPEIEYVHPLKEHSWGQRVVRFYDPDHHIIEVGEDMKTVVRRFLDSGMNQEQVASRMEVPKEFVEQWLA